MARKNQVTVQTKVELVGAQQAATQMDKLATATQKANTKMTNSDGVARKARAAQTELSRGISDSSAGMIGLRNNLEQMIHHLGGMMRESANAAEGMKAFAKTFTGVGGVMFALTAVLVLVERYQDEITAAFSLSNVELIRKMKEAFKETAKELETMYENLAETNTQLEYFLANRAKLTKDETNIVRNQQELNTLRSRQIELDKEIIDLEFQKADLVRKGFATFGVAEQIAAAKQERKANDDRILQLETLNQGLIETANNTFLLEHAEERLKKSREEPEAEKETKLRRGEVREDRSLEIESEREYQQVLKDTDAVLLRQAEIRAERHEDALREEARLERLSKQYQRQVGLVKEKGVVEAAGILISGKSIKKIVVGLALEGGKVVFLTQLYKKLNKARAGGDLATGGLFGIGSGILSKITSRIGFAEGGTVGGGPIVVGERGPELLWSNRGQYVQSSGSARNTMGGGGDIVIQISGKEVARVKQRNDKEVAQTGTGFD